MVVDDSGVIADFTEANAITDSYKIKEDEVGKASKYCTKKVRIMIPLKYLSHFWRTLEMPLITCESNFHLNWCENCVIVVTNVAA